MMKNPINRLSPYLRNATPAGGTADHPHEGTALSRLSPPYSLDDRIVSFDEASAISDLSKDTLRRCHQRKELENIELSPRRRGIRLSALWAFIQARAA